MASASFQSKIAFIIIAAALLAGLGAGWWLCCRSDSIDFLPYYEGANWIIDLQPPEHDVRLAAPLRTIFKRSFILNTVPDEATINICAFKSATVTLNNQEIDGLKLDGKDWKLPVTASVAKMLHVGTNEISVSVTNSLGPPALWFRLQAGTLSLGSDEQWLSSPTGSYWQNAHRASIPPELPDWSGLKDEMTLSQAIRGVWLELALFTGVALAVIFLSYLWLKREMKIQPEKAAYILLGLILLARAALWIHDAPLLSPTLGFDAPQHEDYVRFIQQKGTLPLPSDGWEMKQPPLYYIGAATFLGTFGLLAGDDDAVIPLRAVNGIIGLLQCWLVLLCLQRLFPKNFYVQAIGLLVASFLPANLYISMYVANDPLVGLLVTLAFYLFLRLLESKNESPKLAIGLGLALGLAMLAKLSALLAVLVFLAALGLWLLQQKSRPRRWLMCAGVVTLVCALTCGWHYVRVWRQIGGLPLPNNRTNLLADWWQEPGFRTIHYYLGFGHALVSPLFSDRYSFADGIYSTLWADGLISGNSHLYGRPPWNYDLIYLSCLLAMALTFLAVLGLIAFLRKFIRTIDPLAGLLAGMIFVFAAALVLMTLVCPALGAAKAFYAIPALVPFSACIALGAEWLAQKTAARIVLGALVLVWVAMAFSSFWIHTDNYELWRLRAASQLAAQNFPGALENINHALKLNPGDPASQVIFAEALSGQGETQDAIREYEEILSRKPDFPIALDDLAPLLATGEKADKERAVQLAAHACELTNYRQVAPVTTLAWAQIHAGMMDNAISSFNLACDLAINTGRPGLLDSLAMDLNNAAWLLSTSKDGARRNGPDAIQLAQRACELAQYRNVVFVGTLAAAYAEAGNFDSAVANMQRACKLAEQNGEEELLQQDQRYLELYRAHKPAREGN
jgi:4-amino-4-deoxy-L-arabinose transferase-like glycosyltransferase